MPDRQSPGAAQGRAGERACHSGRPTSGRCGRALPPPSGSSRPHPGQDHAVARAAVAGAEHTRGPSPSNSAGSRREIERAAVLDVPRAARQARAPAAARRRRPPCKRRPRGMPAARSRPPPCRAPGQRAVDEGLAPGAERYERGEPAEQRLQRGAGAHQNCTRSRKDPSAPSDRRIACAPAPAPRGRGRVLLTRDQRARAGRPRPRERLGSPRAPPETGTGRAPLPGEAGDQQGDVRGDGAPGERRSRRPCRSAMETPAPVRSPAPGSRHGERAAKTPPTTSDPAAMPPLTKARSRAASRRRPPRDGAAGAA